MRRYARLSLDPLDPRLTPAATPIDLMSRGASAVAGAGIVTQTDTQPTGTGVIHSFVRVQGPANGGTEQGYNTDARPLQFDENKSPSFTRHLTVGDVPVVQRNGVAYREFLLDINQKASGSGSKLSLDEVRVYLTDRPDAAGYNATAKTLDGKAAVYDLDAGGDRTVLLDARLNNGSGSGDMFLLVPDAAFTDAGLGTYVNLFSKFGGTYQANSGFEEWAVRTTGTPVAPPGTAGLSGTVFYDADGDGTFGPGESGIGGVTVRLQGTNDLGQTVVLTAVTNADGSYSFAGLRVGTYSLFETQPVNYLDGQDTLGSLGGVLGNDNDSFLGIDVTVGANGTGYNFGEILTPPPPPSGGGGGVDA